MTGTVVGVLRGGPSREHDISLQTGHAAILGLPSDRFTVRDIYIDKAGVWHERGRVMTPMQALRAVDVVIVGLHGEFGEDGDVQKILERFRIPYTGSDSFASYMAMHKVLAKERARDMGLLVPRYHLIESENDIERLAIEINHSFLQPVIVKPVKGGSSIGISRTHGYTPLVQAARALFRAGSGGVLVEEIIKGTEASVGVVEHLRGETLYALPPVEIIPPEGNFFSYEAKYSGKTQELCPARFSKQLNDELMRLARVMHEALGLRHYSRSDFIVSPKGIYYLETNTLPGLSRSSLFPKSLAAVGITSRDFMSHLVDLALDQVDLHA